jgi:hypothetical protein
MKIPIPRRATPATEIATMTPTPSENGVPEQEN